MSQLRDMFDKPINRAPHCSFYLKKNFPFFQSWLKHFAAKYELFRKQFGKYVVYSKFISECIVQSNSFDRLRSILTEQ